jgi:glycosyltransferase involved in cell wall biosynthesis
MVNASTKEAMPNAFLEAAAHRCAILAALDPDGFSSKFGYFVQKKDGGDKYADADDFARGLAWLLDGDRWREQGQRGYEHVRATFENEVAIQRHLEVYRRALDKGCAATTVSGT